MTRYFCRIVAAAGGLLCTSAAAEVVTVRWSVSNHVPTPESPTTTVLMTATWGPPLPEFFATAEFDILGTNTFGGLAEGSTYGGRFHLAHNMIEGFVDTALPNENNDLLDGIAFCVPPFFGGYAASPLLWSFDFTAADFTPRIAEYTSDFSEFQLYESEHGGLIDVETVVTPVTFRVVPAPGAAALLPGASCSVVDGGPDMLRRISLISGLLGCLACRVASADVVTVEWSVSNPVLTPSNPTTTVLMRATWSEDLGINFAVAQFAILGTSTYGGIVGAEGWGDRLYLLHNMVEAWVETDVPNSNNDLFNGEALCFPPFFHGIGRSPMDWWFTYTATDFTGRTAAYTSEFEVFRLYTDGWGTSVELETLVIPATFRVVPAPGAALLMTACLAIRTKRRATPCFDAPA